MAFFSKVGNILKQASISQVINAELSSSKSKASIFQAVRCFSAMASSKLFVGGLSYSTDQAQLAEAFSKYGHVVEARVIIDRESGRSRGFGFVTFTSTEEASSAIQALDGQNLHGRNVKVNYATERAPRSFGDGGYGGGYGNNSGGYGGNSSYGSGYSNAYGSQGSYGGNSGSQGGYDNNFGGDAGGNFAAPAEGTGPVGGAGFEFGNSSGNFEAGATPGGYGQNDSFGGNFGDEDDLRKRA